MKRVIVSFLICLIFCWIPVFGDENSDVDEDELFGDDMITTEDEGGDTDTGTDQAGTGEDEMVNEADRQSGLDQLLLKNETVELGGKFKLTLNPSWTWQQKDLSPDYIMDNITKADIIMLTSTLEAAVFLDARPDENFRVFGKTDLSAPLNQDEEWTVHIQELFADFNWKDKVFFRAGKQTLKWGVGYFFSPADVVNLTPIDPEDPKADREGPVALKTQIPIDIHNLYLYIITENVAYPEDIGIAPKFEFVVGNVETGIGGFYQKDMAPMGVLTVTYPFTSGVNLFAEGVLSYGANKRFIEVSDENPDTLVATDRDNEFFFSGTLGFLVLLNQFDTEWEAITFAGQYYFNGYGYSDPSIYQNQDRLIPLFQDGEITMKDLMQPGMHYAACAVSWNEMFDSDFSTALFWMGNLSDGSGMVTPSVTWNIIDYVQAALRFPVVYGGDFDEFSFMGRKFGISLEVALGYGKF